MAHTPASNESDRPGGKTNAVTGAGLIHVPASEQQVPGTIRRCPVCGQPYTPGTQPIADEQAEPTAAEARKVFLCAYCKTYSVGVLDGADEEAGD